MTKEFVPYPEALELKHLGFDESCFGCYEEIEKRDYLLCPTLGQVILEITKSIELNTLNGIRCYNQEDKVSAPTYSQAFRFFREKHNMKFHIRQNIWNNWCEVKIKFHIRQNIWNNLCKVILEHDKYVDICESESYEEAELACLGKLIELVKNK